MNVHWLQHAAHEDLGCIAPWLAARGDQVTHTRLYAGETLPAVDTFDWLMVMGGPMNIYQYERHPWLRAEKQLIRAAVDAGKRVLGICLGSQLLADVCGGKVTRNAHTEIGWHEVRCSAARIGPFTDFPAEFLAFHWHGDTFALPPGAQPLMHSEACANQAFALSPRVAGIQFHLEVTAADARVWFEHEQPAEERYVQTPVEILSEVARFADNNRLMLRLLEAMSA